MMQALMCRFGGQACIPVARSTPVCGTQNAVREQFNENTAFIDASVVYGSSTRDVAKLRNGQTGFMQTSFIVRQRSAGPAAGLQ